MRSFAGHVPALYDAEVELYDIAFGWDVVEEVDWLVERLGRRCTSVLEPGCGTGRMLEAFASRGLEVIGIDASPAMVRFARARLEAAGVRAEIVLADMSAFDLGRRLHGAVCPINTLAHLEADALARHLDCMARHLEPGTRYLVQLALSDPSDPPAPAESTWEASRGSVQLRVTWAMDDIDVAQLRQWQRSRIEVVSGPRAGDIVEDLHTMTMWTPATWGAAVGESQFRQVAAYDGNEPGRPRVATGTPGGLMWHELALV